MFVQQIYTSCLSQASYYIESSGLAAIIDPMRDVDGYIEMASKRNAKIRYVFVTHFHADFVSGHLELAKRTGAVIVFGPQAKPNYNAVVAEDEECFYLGNCIIKVLHTPGHTMESACFLLYDEHDKAYAVFTGDTLFIGDVGRPDLLSGNLNAGELALKLYDSIEQKIKMLPDDVIVYPGHGAGSACGKNLSEEKVSTIGAQRKTNYALNLDKEDFVEAVTTDQPFAPAYFFKDAWINMNGYADLENILDKSLKSLTAEEFKNEIKNDVVIIDTRPASDFAKGFIKGAINIGLDGQFASWAGTVVDFNHRLLLVTEPGFEKQAVTRLARIGYEKVIGFLKDGIDAWKKSGEPTDRIDSLGIDQLNRTEYKMLDVRRLGEFEKEHLPDSLHLPLEQLSKRINELDKKPYAVYCAGGYRSMIAASILKRNGFEHVINIEGGIASIKKDHPELIETV